MVDDHDAVAGEMDVELETVGAERKAVIEGREGVLGPQRRAAAMGIDERARENRRGQSGDLNVNSQAPTAKCQGTPELPDPQHRSGVTTGLGVAWSLGVGSALEVGSWKLGVDERSHLIRCPMASARPSTLGELRAAVDAGRVKRRPVRDEVRENLVARLRAGQAALPRHHRLRRHGRPADRQRHSVAPQFHPARPARPGEEPHPARPHGPARRRDCRGAGLRDSRRPAGAALRRLPGARQGGRRRPADPLAVARRALRREARHARRHHRRHDRRPRSDQGGALRPRPRRRADDALRAGAAGEPRHLRDQRAAGSRRQDPGRAVQHPAGGGRPDKGLPDPPAARRADGVQRQPRGLHRARQDHHAAQGPHRLGDPHALPGDAQRRHGDHRAGSLAAARRRRHSRVRP